jgi:hypothetical protein
MRLPLVAPSVAVALLLSTAFSAAAGNPNREKIKLNAADQAAARTVLVTRSD